MQFVCCNCCCNPVVVAFVAITDVVVYVGFNCCYNYVITDFVVTDVVVTDAVVTDVVVYAY